MIRVVATLKASRSIVTMSRIVGKDENSSGRFTHSATMRISTAAAIEKARPASISRGGSGRNSTARISTIPAAKPMSVRPASRLSGRPPLVVCDTLNPLD